MHKANETRELCLSSSLRVNGETAFRSLGGEGVLLRMDTAEYFGLDAVGSKIWLLLEQGKELPEVLQALHEEYECSEQQCRDDLFRFLGRLAELGLVSVSEQVDDTKSCA